MAYLPSKSGKGYTFVPDPKGFQIFARSSFVVKGMFGVVSQAAQGARQIAPVDEGNYRRSIRADAGIGDTGVATGRLLATDFKSVWIEFGTVRQPPQSVLARAIEQATGSSPRDGVVR